LALLKDGKVRAFGYNGDGQCDVLADAQGNCISVAADDNLTVALLKDGKVSFSGRVRAFGEKNAGQCDAPADVQGNCISVAPGQYHTVALLKDLKVRAFGRNDDGQCDVQLMCRAIASVLLPGPTTQWRC